MRLTNYQRAYFAGFFDGEGSVGIYGVGTSSVSFKCSLCNNDPKPLRLIKKVYGWYVRLRDRHRLGWQDNYEWTAHSISSANFLKDIFPYLLIKRQQALVYLNARKYVGVGGTGRGLKRSTRISAKYKQASAKLKSLKRPCRLQPTLLTKQPRKEHNVIPLYS